MFGLYLSALSNAISASAVRPCVVSTLPKFPYAVNNKEYDYYFFIIFFNITFEIIILQVQVVHIKQLY